MNIGRKTHKTKEIANRKADQRNVFRYSLKINKITSPTNNKNNVQ